MQTRHLQSQHRRLHRRNIVPLRVPIPKRQSQQTQPPVEPPHQWGLDRHCGLYSELLLLLLLLVLFGYLSMHPERLSLPAKHQPERHCLSV